MGKHNKNKIKQEPDTEGDHFDKSWVPPGRHNPLAHPRGHNSVRGGRRRGRGGGHAGGYTGGYARGGYAAGNNRGGFGGRGITIHSLPVVQMVPALTLQSSMKHGNPLARLSLHDDESGAHTNFMGRLLGVDGGAIACCATTDEMFLSALHQARTNTRSEEIACGFFSPKRDIPRDDPRWITHPVQWFTPGDPARGLDRKAPDPIKPEMFNDDKETKPPNTLFRSWYVVIPF
ncbi:hypothetical protein G7Z17_g4553 [Cylindrodendrum hubeiense]|uniref:Uncharacterized protein n=1 Tax=Cylindrodendrum hubeiense TaxID=595255 RepID=A0A9P5LCJ5_9HYPO|nr:hypothetical protein G7Z17_g4553 [Cylindrodendrum hubeiense]